MLRFERNVIDLGKYFLSAENAWYLLRGFSAAERSIVPTLQARHWGAYISPTGNFIGSDNPVSMDGPAGQQIGFKSADIVMFPVNRHVLLYGWNECLGKTAFRNPEAHRKAQHIYPRCAPVRGSHRALARTGNQDGRKADGPDLVERCPLGAGAYE